MSSADQRLEALRACQVMDTPREAMFDSVVFTAAQILRAPLACLTLVERDRVWNKAFCGPRITNWTRVAAFCSLVVEQESFEVIEDLQADSRFGTAAVPTEGVVPRFAAGAPVEGPDGIAIGCLCVLDRRSRTATSRQLLSLGQLARQAGELLQLRAPLQRMVG